MNEPAAVLNQTFVIGILSLRLIVLLAAVFFCYLGYRLFSKVSTLSNAEISIGEHFRANFVQVGPGVFFSLFGSVILVYSLMHPAVLEQWQTAVAPVRQAADTAPAISSTTQGVTIAGATAESVALDDAAALSRARKQVEFLNRIDSSGSVAPQDVKDIDRLSRMIRLAVMKSAWQSAWGDAAAFKQWVDDPDGHTPNEQARQFFERN